MLISPDAPRLWLTVVTVWYPYTIRCLVTDTVDPKPTTRLNRYAADPAGPPRAGRNNHYSQCSAPEQLGNARRASMAWHCHSGGLARA